MSHLLFILFYFLSLFFILRISRHFSLKRFTIGTAVLRWSLRESNIGLCSLLARQPLLTVTLLALTKLTAGVTVSVNGYGCLSLYEAW